MMRAPSYFIVLLLATIAPATYAAEFNATIVDQNGQPVADAVLTATPIGGDLKARPGAGLHRDAEVDQIDKEFVPFVTVVQAGNAIAFPNHDRTRHQIYSFSAAKKFDLPLYAETTPPPVLFDKPGVVVIGCNIHDWMLAYIYVADTPYFGKSNKHGNIKLDDLPRGEYHVQLWHPNLDGSAPAALAVTIDTQNIDLGKIPLSIKAMPRPRRAPLPSERAY